VSGPEILEVINTDPRLRRIPVVVLTTSAAEEDVVRTYDRHANAYVTKPVDVDRFLDVVRPIDDLYLTVVQPPRGGESR
jgi:CheY-like chemotaxis protein